MIKKVCVILLLAFCLCSCGKATKGTEQTEGIDFSTENGAESQIEAEFETESTEIETTVDTEDATENNEEPTYTFEEYVTPKTMYANTSANVRDIPEKTGSKVGSLSINQEVIVLGKCNETGWYKIEYKDAIGYVSNNYLVEQKVTVEQATQEQTSTSDTSSDVAVEESEPTPTKPVYTDISQIDTSRPYVECMMMDGLIVYCYVPNEILNLLSTEGATGYGYHYEGYDSSGNPLIRFFVGDVDQKAIDNTVYISYCDGTIAFTRTVTYSY